jgi:hypothetical protein
MTYFPSCRGWRVTPNADHFFFRDVLSHASGISFFFSVYLLPSFRIQLFLSSKSCIMSTP